MKNIPLRFTGEKNLAETYDASILTPHPNCTAGLQGEMLMYIQTLTD